MNRSDFLNIIQSETSVSRQMLGEVYELIDIFPYFQSAHLLLLKGLQNNADVKFERQLRNSAIYIADREVLYYMLKSIQSPEPPASGPVEEILVQEDISTQSAEPFPNGPVAEIPVQEDIPTQSAEPVPAGPVAEIPVQGDISTDTQQTVIEAAMNSEQLIVEIEKDDISSESSEINFTGEEHTHQVLIATESEDDDSSGVMLLLEDDSNSPEERVFFMDPGFSAFEEESDLLELEIEQSSDEESDDQEIDLSDSGSLPISSKKQIQSELIDKFITANPRIEPSREKSELPPEDISKPSVEEATSFVTETLAQIYINQGYYSKAMDIYEKLSLKFPEKSSYFASQIEKVKEYLKK